MKDHNFVLFCVSILFIISVVNDVCFLSMSSMIYEFLLGVCAGLLWAVVLS